MCECNCSCWRQRKQLAALIQDSAIQHAAITLAAYLMHTHAIQLYIALWYQCSQLPIHLHTSASISIVIVFYSIAREALHLHVANVHTFNFLSQLHTYVHTPSVYMSRGILYQWKASYDTYTCMYVASIPLRQKQNITCHTMHSLSGFMHLSVGQLYSIQLAIVPDAAKGQLDTPTVIVLLNAFRLVLRVVSRQTSGTSLLATNFQSK